MAARYGSPLRQPALAAHFGSSQWQPPPPTTTIFAKFADLRGGGGLYPDIGFTIEMFLGPPTRNLEICDLRGVFTPGGGGVFTKNPSVYIYHTFYKDAWDDMIYHSRNDQVAETGIHLSPENTTFGALLDQENA